MIPSAVPWPDITEKLDNHERLQRERQDAFKALEQAKEAERAAVAADKADRAEAVLRNTKQSTVTKAPAARKAVEEADDHFEALGLALAWDETAALVEKNREDSRTRRTCSL